MDATGKIKLLIITPSLACGGSEKFVSVLCNYADTERFAICLVIINNRKPFYDIVNPAIKIIDLGKNRVLFSLFAIKKAVMEFNPDIIFSTANHLNVYLAIFKNQFNSKIKFVGRESNMVSINSQEAKLPVVYNRLIKKYYNRFDMLVCQSKEMQQDLVQHYKIPFKKTIVVHNPVPEVDISWVQAKDQNVHREAKFITIARLCNQKGIERLIHAVGLLSIPFQYYIIGDGDKKTELEKLINELQLSNKVHLLGEKVQPFAGMENADLFLMGSYYEGFPNAVLEAGAYGIPVIAFDAPGGMAEIIVEAENGMLVANNDIIAFAAAINTALDTQFNHEQIIETTKNRFGVNKIIPALEDLFLTLAENN